MDLQHLRASDGTGEAVLAHIDAPRNPGSTVLSLDNVDNWNSKAVIVTGTPAANGFIAAAGMKVMYGHITAGDFIIDGFAAGYADNGNTTQEIAIVKMTTSWADALVNILGQSLQDSGLLKTTSLDHFFKPSELISNYIASGGVVAQTVTLTGSFSDIVYYINGLRYTKSAVTNKVYTASKDTYVDIGTDGVVDYTEVANGAASPALAANHIRIAKVVTSGVAITSVSQFGADSLLNSIYPRGPITGEDINFPSFNWYGYRAGIVNTAIPGGFSFVALNGGLLVPFYAIAGVTYEIMISASFVSPSVNTQTDLKAQLVGGGGDIIDTISTNGNPNSIGTPHMGRIPWTAPSTGIVTVTCGVSGGSANTVRTDAYMCTVRRLT